MAAWPWRNVAATGGGAARRCAVELTDLIVSDPGVMSGTPCFRGTRVPVSVVFGNLAAGMWTSPLGVEGLLTNPGTPGGRYGRKADPAAVHG
jgi:hypothetical protein